MNIRKPVDYSTMFVALDALIAADLPQVELYVKIGQLVSSRPEKGAAVAAAEYLRGSYPDASGFSPWNLRRMREFYCIYKDASKVLSQAMTIGWTQNVVILEAKLTLQEREWYIQAVGQFRWSKLELQRKIAANAHQEIVLDFTDDICYTEEKSTSMACIVDDENPLYMQEPENQIGDERLRGKSWVGEHRVHSNQRHGDWGLGLSVRPTQNVRIWIQLHQQSNPSVEERGLRPVRPPDWDGSG